MLFASKSSESKSSESKSSEGSRLLAWRVGTPEVYLVSRFAGAGTLVDWRPAS